MSDLDYWQSLAEETNTDDGIDWDSLDSVTAALAAPDGTYDDDAKHVQDTRVRLERQRVQLLAREADRAKLEQLTTPEELADLIPRLR